MSIRHRNYMKFLIDSIREGDVVVGRNFNQDIPIGTVFTYITKSEVVEINDEYKTIELGKVGSINLILKKIDWYNRHIEVVPGGHTARLHLHGTGLEMIKKILKDLREYEYLSINA